MSKTIHKLLFPHKKGNYVIVLNKVENGMSLTKYDSDGNNVTKSNSPTSNTSTMYNLNEVLAALKDEYKIEDNNTE